MNPNSYQANDSFLRSCGFKNGIQTVCLSFMQCALPVVYISSSPSIYHCCSNLFSFTLPLSQGSLQGKNPTRGTFELCCQSIMQLLEVLKVNNCHFFPLQDTRIEQAVRLDGRDIKMTKGFDFYGSQLPFVEDNSWKYCRKREFANTKLDLYANLHIIM